MTHDRFIAAAFREWADRKKGAGLPEDDIIYSIEQKAAELARESVGDGELLPCPFCGKAPRMFIGYKAAYDVKILCDWCGAEGATFGDDDFKGAERQSWIDNAITAWNTRAAGDDARDARRYRWLRISADVSWNGYVTYSNLMATDAEREEMDAAIDSAIVRSAE